MVDGIIGGVGTIVTFLPNILILFLCLALLEDSGYMARVAYVMEGIMSKLGLSGKAFIPMLLGFGCTVPAIMASRALMNRQRESGAFVLAVDLPSGINTDTGEAAEGAVRADLTVTFDSCKPLHTAPSSAPFCGEIVCADIGIRDEWHPAGLAQL